MDCTPVSLQEQMSVAIRMSHVDSKVSVQTHFRLCQTHLVKGFVIALFISCLNWNVRSMHSTLSQEFPLFHTAATAGTFCWLTQPDLLQRPLYSLAYFSELASLIYLSKLWGVCKGHAQDVLLKLRRDNSWECKIDSVEVAGYQVGVGGMSFLPQPYSLRLFREKSIRTEVASHSFVLGLLTEYCHQSKETLLSSLRSVYDAVSCGILKKIWPIKVEEEPVKTRFCLDF